MSPAHHHRFSTLRARLMQAFLALGLLPLTIAGGALAWNAYQDDLDEAWTYQRELSRRVSLQLEAYLLGVERDVAGLDRYRPFSTLDADEQGRLFSELLHTGEGVRELALVDRDGAERLRVSRTHLVAGDAPHTRFDAEAVACALDGGGVCYGDIHFAEETGEPHFTLAHPLSDPRRGATTAVIAATVSLKPVWNLIAELHLPEEECAFVLDDRQRVVAHPNPSMVLRGSRHPAPTGRGPHTGLEGEPVVAAGREVRLGGRLFQVVAERRLEAAVRPALINLAVIAAVLSLALLLVLAMIWLADRRIIRPIQLVTGAAREIQEGDLERRVELESGDEIGEMATAFNRMTAKLRGSLEELERERSLLRSLIDSIPDLIFIKDRELRFSNCNRAFEQRAGRSAEELIGKDVFELFPAEEAESYYRSDQQLLKGGEPVRSEELVTAEGGRVTTYDTVKVPLFDADGNPRGLIGVARDITDRKRIEEELARHRDHLEERVAERGRELEAAHDELLRKERLATLGQLTATVSHELRNPLGAIRPSLFLIKRRVEEGDERMRHAVERIERSVTRCDHIIDELLDFTRIRTLERETLPFDRWLEELLDEQPIPEGIALQLERGLAERRLSIDPHRLRRAVINVVENAIHALQEERPDDAPAGEPPRLTVATAERDGRIEIRVEDNGPGIPEEILPKVFEPLYSTKGFGVGLGLPTVKQILEQHGGDIEITTEHGRGTTMVLWLPSADDQ